MNKINEILDRITQEYPWSYYNEYWNQMEFFLNTNNSEYANKNKWVFKITTTKDNVLYHITRILLKC